MISFVISLVALMVGYLIYSKFIEYRFGLDNHSTSVVLKTDAVDSITMSNQNVRSFMWPCISERKTIK